MPNVAPVRARVRMYQVGLGDCFLLSFEYPEQLDDGRDERHILIDFGAKPPPRPGYKLEQIAELINEHSNGKLDVLVATHRHQDHLAAFAKDEVVEIIDELEPGLIVRPWTEDPEAESDATAPGVSASVHFAARLNQAQAAIEQLARELEGLSLQAQPELRELAALAATQIRNAKAVRQLDTWADDGTRGEYLHAGTTTRIEDIVPNVRVHVLGPPTIEQYPAVRRPRDEDRDEFWLAASDPLAAGLPRLLGTDATPSRERGVRIADLPPGPARTVAERLSEQRLDMLLSIVRTMDRAMNNTSLILLFEAGTKRLLFPGDAQIENWEFALSREDDRALLREVDLYKVGHHGSRNATPKSLFDLWNDSPNLRPMIAMMSTMRDVHGESEATKVPRRTLVAALNRRTGDHLLRTDQLSRSRFYIEAEGSLTDDEAFREVEDS